MKNANDSKPYCISESPTAQSKEEQKLKYRLEHYRPNYLYG